MSQKLLTLEGPLALAPEQRKIMALFENGMFLVSQTHINDPHVLSFEARARKLGYPIQKLPTDLQSISDAYAGTAGKSGSRENTRTIRDVQNLLAESMKARASDIHIRVGQTAASLWLRVHGDLTFKREWDPDYAESLCSTIYTALADVSDTSFKPRQRQDARIASKEILPKGLHGVRIATTPTVDGFLMVMRMLYEEVSADNSLDSLGFYRNHQQIVNLMKARPTGMNIIAGPTGSGKSTTLQRILRALIEERMGRIHVITVEDPPEYPIPGSVQTPVTNAETAEERHAAFSNAISGAMRLDPDVIMIGEIRDNASAALGVRAAMTGHQVWSTVHANSAMAIIDRLVDLEVPLSLLADTTVLSGLVFQRLAKTLCPHCSEPLTDVLKKEKSNHRIAPDLLRRVQQVLPIETSQIRLRGAGCDKCEGSGLAGRTVVVETITPDARMLQMIRAGARAEAEAYWRQELHGRTVLEHALDKVRRGLIDPAMAEDVVGPLSTDVLTSVAG